MVKYMTQGGKGAYQELDIVVGIKLILSPAASVAS